MKHRVLSPIARSFRLRRSGCSLTFGLSNTFPVLLGLRLLWQHFESYWSVVGKGSLLSRLFCWGQWPCDSTVGQKLGMRVGCLLGPHFQVRRAGIKHPS